MNDNLDRYFTETQEEAHYWFVLSDFVNLSLDYSFDKVMTDMIQLREQRKKSEVTTQEILS